MTELSILIMVGEGSLCCGPSLCTLYEVGRLLQRQPVVGFGGGRGVAIHRTEAVRKMARTLGSVNSWRGVLMDYDTLVDGSAAPWLARDIQKADDLDLNLVAPIKDREGNWNIYHDDRTPFAELPPNLAEVKLAGLGFYYGNVPSDYRFHEGDNGYGEDENFFLDNNLRPRVITDVEFKHLKVMPL